MSEILFDRIALIGIGLIGSSIARDVKKLGLAKEVVISTRSAETLKRAEELELGTAYIASAADAVKDADLVLKVFLHHVELFLLDGLRAVVLLDALAREDLDAHDDALDAGRADVLVPGPGRPLPPRPAR